MLLVDLSDAFPALRLAPDLPPLVDTGLVNAVLLWTSMPTAWTEDLLSNEQRMLDLQDTQAAVTSTRNE